MATSTPTNQKKNSGAKKSDAVRLTPNDKLVLKRARVLPRGKRMAPKKNGAEKGNNR